MNYIQQALKGKNDWWRTFIIVFVFVLIFGLSFLTVIYLTPEQISQAMAITGIKNVDLAINYRNSEYC